MSETQNKIKLPLSIAQPVDIGLVLREVNLIDEYLNQQAIRGGNEQKIKLSPKLKELVDINNLDLINKEEHRQVLADWLDYLRLNAPIVNISFGSEASDEFINKIVGWFRQEVDPLCLIVVGLQPNIGIGSVLRTNNKIFDLSLRQRLSSNHKLLNEEIHKLNEQSTNGRS